MKRSSMIELLVEAIDDGETNYKILEARAELLLGMLEDAGMLPPPDGFEAVTTSIAYAYYNDRVDDRNSEDDRPDIEKLWEPEDDE